MDLEKVSTNKLFGGQLFKYKFKSESLGGTVTQINVFTPPKATKAPILVYLAGLTCTEDTGAQKGGFFKDAAAEGIALVFPDTSPRGAGIEGEEDDGDFGTGAGFYLNATNAKYAKHYNTYDYVTQELTRVLEATGLPLDLSRQSIFGHSMGGHGALTLYLTTKGQYRSCSAFAPAANPSQSPWGQKAFKGYLAGGLEEGKEKYDATELIAKTKEPVHILVDYGTSDNFYKQKQLLPENFLKAARDAGHDEMEVRVRSQEDYDHSYFFISSFASDHIHFHANFLKA